MYDIDDVLNDSYIDPRWILRIYSIKSFDNIQNDLSFSK